ncbi:hypothetical protein D3C87_1437000 [compost metagenome]
MAQCFGQFIIVITLQDEVQHLVDLLFAFQAKSCPVEVEQLDSRLAGGSGGANDTVGIEHEVI